jgi:CubicO group peptidase (beta-lactamase class C family)
MSSLEIRVDPLSLGFDPARLARIKPHFDKYVDDRRLPGWLATVSRGGELVWTDKGGFRDREKELDVTDDTIWRIYSMTKPITSIAVMMLYEEGLFDLNDDVGQWIDALKEPRVWAGGTAAKPQTVPAIEPVRVHHLLSQMSGLTYGFHYAHPTEGLRLRVRAGRGPRPGRPRLVFEPARVPARERLELLGLGRRARTTHRDLEWSDIQGLSSVSSARTARYE